MKPPGTTTLRAWVESFTEMLTIGHPEGRKGREQKNDFLRDCTWWPREGNDHVDVSESAVKLLESCKYPKTSPYTVIDGDRWPALSRFWPHLNRPFPSFPGPLFLELLSGLLYLATLSINLACVQTPSPLKNRRGKFCFLIMRGDVCTQASINHLTDGHFIFYLFSNAIGPLISLWVIFSSGVIQNKVLIPFWTLVYGSLGICIGLFVWGCRVIKTVGEDLTPITPSR